MVLRVVQVVEAIAVNWQRGECRLVDLQAFSLNHLKVDRNEKLHDNCAALESPEEQNDSWNGEC